MIALLDNRVKFLILHVIVGLLIYMVNKLVFPFIIIFLIYGSYILIKTRDNNNIGLFLVSYILGFEVLFRMKSGGSMYDIGKYSMLIFSLLGIFFNKVNLKSWPYLLIILLFIPAILISINSEFYEINYRKKLAFNLLGPVSMCVFSMYCYSKEITLKEFSNLFFVTLGPLVSILINLILYTPSDLMTVITNTSSNFETSGGFGPNQMSVILGLGLFITVILLLLNKFDKLLTGLLCFVGFMFAYRGLITFSRGGILTSLVMIIVFLVFLYIILPNAKQKNNLIFTFFVFIIIGLGVWSYAKFQTGGLIQNRYENKDAIGRVKESKLSGREDIMEYDLQLYKDNPVFGVGVGLSTTLREESALAGANSHSEPTRLLAEHGSVGLIVLLILIFVPIIKNLKYYLIYNNLFVIPFLLFWMLTINHAATRLVAPGVIYALSLINLKYNDDEENSLPRE